jgi:predicted transcriptional regulator of viral defense system
MKSIELLKELRAYPLFTVNDLAKILGKNPGYVAVLIKRLLDRKLVQRIERGKYTLHEDPLVFSSHIKYPAYIALWSALRFHNLTTQLPNTVFVCTPASKKSIKFPGTGIVFVKNHHFWGYEKYAYDEFEIFVSDREKTLIDCMLTGKVPLHEVADAITEVDGEKLVEYAKKTKNTSLIKRIGYLLEVSGREYKDLLKWVKYPYAVMDTHFKREGIRNHKWKLMINNRE